MENSEFGDEVVGAKNATLYVTTDLLPVEETTFESNYINLVIEICVMIIILIGNSLTVAAICTTPSLQTVTYRLVQFLVIERTNLVYFKY